jgi:hypothetical protein
MISEDDQDQYEEYYLREEGLFFERYSMAILLVVPFLIIVFVMRGYVLMVNESNKMNDIQERVVNALPEIIEKKEKMEKAAMGFTGGRASSSNERPSFWAQGRNNSSSND